MDGHSVFIDLELRVFQPLLIFLQCDFSLFALRLFLPGFFTPGAERRRGDLPGLRPGKSFFIFQAVSIEDLILLLALRAVGESADLLAGAAVLSGGDVVVPGSALAFDSEVEAAVY